MTIGWFLKLIFSRSGPLTIKFSKSLKMALLTYQFHITPVSPKEVSDYVVDHFCTSISNSLVMMDTRSRQAQCLNLAIVSSFSVLFKVSTH